MNHTLSDSQLEEMIKSAVNSSAPLPPDEKFSQLISALRELQERRKAAEPELNPANLANKFYERYPLATFKSDSERAEAFGYFMAGAELQCFGEFIKYEDLCGDE